MEEYKRAMYVVLETLANYEDDLEVLVQDTANAFGLDDAEHLIEMVTREIEDRVNNEFSKNC